MELHEGLPAYRNDRPYWRERALDVAPNLTPRETISAARLLADLFHSDQLALDADHQFDPAAGADLAGKIAQLSGAWHRLAPADIAQRALALALDRPNDGNVPAITPAPDPYDGVRHTVSVKRSNSGRQNRTVTRSGVAVVQGRADRQSDGSPACLLVSTSDSPLLASLSAHILASLPRRGAGTNALSVMAYTSQAFDLPAISDLRAWREITPELGAGACAGIALHRADLTGYAGNVSLPDDLSAAQERQATPTRLALAPIRLRKSEANYASDRQLVAPADTPRLPAPVRERLTVRDETGRLIYASASNASAELAPAITPAPESLWIGHDLRLRGKYARKVSAKKATTIASGLILASADDLTAAAASLNRGERITGATATGDRWALSRSKKGRYAWSQAGKKAQRVTPEGIGRSLAVKLAST